MGEWDLFGVLLAIVVSLIATLPGNPRASAAATKPSPRTISAQPSIGPSSGQPRA